VGVGLIGGSLGMAIRKRYPSVKVTGVDKPAILRKALLKKAIQRGVPRIERALEGADLVIVATPLRTILSVLTKISRAGSHVLITDVGSVKTPVLRKAEKLFPAGNFIGGHPMAGVELAGIEAAHPLMFENAVYVLSPSRRTTRSSIKRLSSFIEGLGARILILDANVHDAVASAVSHVPQLTAVALMTVAGKQHPASRNYLRLAAGGFRDLTRIASSRFELWRSILGFNRKEVVRTLDLLIRELSVFRRLLRGNKTTALRASFTQSRQLRDSIPKDMKGFLHHLAAIHVFVPDKPGMLAKMTALLARKSINIKDIELMKIREGTGGTFRLSFDSHQAAERAIAVLKKGGFEAEE
jgi:prephenate dehydrogenase